MSGHGLFGYEILYVVLYVVLKNDTFLYFPVKQHCKKIKFMRVNDSFFCLYPAWQYRELYLIKNM